MTQGCDRSSPRRTSRKPEAIASVSLTKRTQFNRGAGKSLNIVFSRGLRAARTGGVVAAIPFACHTVRRRQRKNLLPNNPPLGFSLGTVTTTETLSTEATPEHHRGCFNAPKFPLTPDHVRPVAPDHIPVIPDRRPIGDLRDILQTVIPGEGHNPPNGHTRQKPEPTTPSFRRRPEPSGVGGPPSVAHEVEPAGMCISTPSFRRSGWAAFRKDSPAFSGTMRGLVKHPLETRHDETRGVAVSVYVPMTSVSQNDSRSRSD